MTSAEQFANLLLVSQGDKELRMAGLLEFQDHISNVNGFGGARLTAFRDESLLLDLPGEDRTRELATFDDTAELARYLVDAPLRQLRELRELLMTDPGSDEFDSDLIPFDFEDEDDDSPELA